MNTVIEKLTLKKDLTQEDSLAFFLNVFSGEIEESLLKQVLEKGGDFSSESIANTSTSNLDLIALNQTSGWSKVVRKSFS